MPDRLPFGQRMGVVAAPQVGLQEVPSELRIALWNIFQGWIFSNSTVPDGATKLFGHIGWGADEISYSIHDNKARLKAWFLDTEWYKVYDFVEWLPDLLADVWDPRYGGLNENRFRNEYLEQLGRVLEKYGAPYRLRSGQLIPITDPAELAEIVKATQTRFQAARDHIAQATRLLSLKPQPDYRNCIKESVSAVESVLKEATGLNMNNIVALLNEFERAYPPAFHQAFRNAVSALYGWTSADTGIRHAIFGDAAEITHADARFMLVTCSAFVNLLVQHTT